jgi:hypothetical protein
VSELYRPSDRCFSAKWLPTFANKGCHVVSVTSLRPYSRFSRQEPLLFYQVAPQLYSWGWVDPVPDPLLFSFGSSGNRTRASGSVAKNSLSKYVNLSYYRSCNSYVFNYLNKSRLSGKKTVLRNNCSTVILCVPPDDGQWRPEHVAVEVQNTINALNSCCEG